MYVIEGLGFIAHPNTASRSVSDALKSMGAISYGSHHKMDLEVIDRCEGCFCAIRNPFDIMASWFYRSQPAESKGPNYKPFDEWLEDALENHKVQYSGPYPELFYGVEHCSHLIRFEYLQSDFDLICRTFGLPRFLLSHEGKTYRPLGYREMYTTPTRRLIIKHFPDQLAMGEYEF
jgi:hypothetical protein